MARFQKSNHSSGPISGLFLLALPLMGLAPFAPTAQAQPTLLSSGKKSFKPLAPEQKAAVDKIMAIARVQDTCAIKLDLKMENATLDDVVATIQQTLPNRKIAVEVRDAKPIHVSFDLKDAKVGKLLTPVAALAGCRLYVFSTGLVIAPAEKLTEAEKSELQQRHSGEWTSNINTNQHEAWEVKTALDPPSIKQKTIEACAIKLDLKMENATLDDVVATIQQTLPNRKIAVEVRDAKPIHVSFDLKDAKVGKLLTPVAALAGCRLYVFSTGLVIAPAEKLTEAEKSELQQRHSGEWTSNINTNQHEAWEVKTALDPPSIKQKTIEACAIKLDLKMENATLDDVVAHIKKNLVDQTVPIEVRGASPVRLSFELKGRNIGNALTPIAALAGCQVYVLDTGLLVAPPSQLTANEKLAFKEMQSGVWEDNIQAGAFFADAPVVDGLKQIGWGIQKEARHLFNGIIVQEIMGDDKKTTDSKKATFAKFSPESQVMLQQMADWVVQNSHATNPQLPFLRLSANSLIDVSISPESIRIDLNGDLSDKKGTQIVMTTYLK